MAFIDSTAIRPKFTSDLIDAYKSFIKPSNFLQKKFKRVAKDTDYLEWNVMRYGEFVAQDVVRGGIGNRNSFATMVQKVEQPPFYYEDLDVMQLEGYNHAFGAVSMTIGQYNDFLETVKFHVGQLIAKVDRAYELQAQQVLLTGTINTNTNGSTNYNRNPGSIIPYSSAIDWSQPEVDPIDVLETMCIYNRTYGLASGGSFDCIMGAGAYNALVNNPIFQSKSQKLWSVLSKLEMPEMADDGAVFQGEIAVKSYRVRIWTYPQYYGVQGTTGLSVQNIPTYPIPSTSLSAANNKSPYIPNNAVIVTPQNPRWIHGFSRVPQLPDFMNMRDSMVGGIGNDGDGPGMYYINEFVDYQRTAWFMGVKSAGLCIPVAVDQMANAFVLAA